MRAVAAVLLALLVVVWADAASYAEDGPVAVTVDGPSLVVPPGRTDSGQGYAGDATHDPASHLGNPGTGSVLAWTLDVPGELVGGHAVVTVASHPVGVDLADTVRVAVIAGGESCSQDEPHAASVVVTLGDECSELARQGGAVLAVWGKPSDGAAGGYFLVVEDLGVQWAGYTLAPDPDPEPGTTVVVGEVELSVQDRALLTAGLGLLVATSAASLVSAWGRDG